MKIDIINIRSRFRRETLTIAVIMAFMVALSCNKSDENTEVSNFQINSPSVASDSLLPVEYTCDGAGVSLPLKWSGAPAETRYFAVIMHHVASPLDIHWYIVLYNIPSTVNYLEKNSTNVGIWGSNSVNGQTEYAPPCSQGPGRKDYIITIYALSEEVTPRVAPAEVDRATLLQAMEGKIISSASMTIWYSRIVK